MQVDDFAITPQWSARWVQLRDRLAEVCARRGGTLRGTGDLSYDLVPATGTPITVIALEAETAQLLIGPLRLLALWALDDDDPSNTLEDLVQQLMDGEVEVRYEVTAGPHKGTSSAHQLAAWPTASARH